MSKWPDTIDPHTKGQHKSHLFLIESINTTPFLWLINDGGNDDNIISPLRINSERISACIGSFKDHLSECFSWIILDP